MKIKLEWEVDTRDLDSVEKVCALVSRAAVVLVSLKSATKDRVIARGDLDKAENNLMKYEEHLRDIGEEK